MLTAGDGSRAPLAGVYGCVFSPRPRFSKHVGPQAHTYHSPSFPPIALASQPASLSAPSSLEPKELKKKKKNQAALGKKCQFVNSLLGPVYLQRRRKF